MTRHDILFYSNANAEVGFGHLRRCLFVADALRGDDDLSYAFAGDFDGDARELIHSEQPETPLYGDVGDSWTEEVKVSVAVLDYMYDAQDAEYYDRSLISTVSDLAERSVVITSSRTAPSDLPVDVVIGHLLDPLMDSRYELKAGLEYSPVAPEVEVYRSSEAEVRDQIERVFVGFGNSKDLEALHTTLYGLEESDYARQVDVLLPPSLYSETDRLGDEKWLFSLNLHHNIPSVPPLLTKADHMIGSYGHMTFEAIALGVPPLIVGTKDFMVEYAQLLAEKSVAINAGHVDALSPHDLGSLISGLTLARRQTLRQNALKEVDGKGLQRVASEIGALRDEVRCGET